MQNPWTAATLGLVMLGAIVTTSTLTTAYLLRPPVSEPADTTPSAPVPPPEPRRPVVRVAPAKSSCDTPGERAVRNAKAGALDAAQCGPDPRDQAR